MAGRRPCLLPRQPGDDGGGPATTGIHHLAGTWRRRVDCFIALSPFAATRFLAGGIPAERLAVAPPVVADPGAAAGGPRAGALYAGRLSGEKGLATLLAAWTTIATPLTIIGDGPEAAALRRMAPANVRFLGHQPRETVSAAMRQAALLVFPSECYENFPLAVAEAMAHSLPVLASTRGAALDMLSDGETGAFAAPGDVADWRRRLDALLATPDRLAAMGAAARRVYETRYAPAIVIRDREALYRRVIAEHES